MLSDRREESDMYNDEDDVAGSKQGVCTGRLGGNIPCVKMDCQQSETWGFLKPETTFIIGCECAPYSPDTPIFMCTHTRV